LPELGKLPKVARAIVSGCLGKEWPGAAPSESPFCAVLVLRAVPAYPSDVSVSIPALAIDALTPTTLYAGTPGGVCTDGGASWSAIGLICVSALAIDPLAPTILYAGSADGVLAGVFKSTDGGASWNATGGLPGPVFVFDPLTPDHPLCRVHGRWGCPGLC
jgi:hypothetical protein